ncbi:hypothetical protein [Amnibacterium kyonggiense]
MAPAAAVLGRGALDGAGAEADGDAPGPVCTRPATRDTGAFTPGQEARTCCMAAFSAVVTHSPYARFTPIWWAT